MACGRLRAMQASRDHRQHSPVLVGGVSRLSTHYHRGVSRVNPRIESTVNALRSAIARGSYQPVITRSSTKTIKPVWAAGDFGQCKPAVIEAAKAAHSPVQMDRMPSPLGTPPSPGKPCQSKNRVNSKGSPQRDRQGIIPTHN